MRKKARKNLDLYFLIVPTIVQTIPLMIELIVDLCELYRGSYFYYIVRLFWSI